MLKFFNFVFLTIAILGSRENDVFAAAIPNLYTTGVDDSGVSLAPGSIDPHYIIHARSDGSLSTNAVVMNGHPWLPNDATSMWIWANQDGTPTPFSVTFRTTFDLAGLNPSTAVINGYWIVDNYATDIRLNGVSTGNPDGGHSLVSFAINHGFVAGINTLDFVVEDYGVMGAFRVTQISGTALPGVVGTVPEPTSMLIFALGALESARRARRRSMSWN